MCFNVTRDGFGAGVDQSLDHPFGHGANPADLFSWAGATASWVNRTDPGGSRGLDDYFTRDMTRNIGAEIMGRNKFGPQRGPWENHDWKGWWGDTPPFHTPVFVLTHHERPSFTLSDTTFHFLNATPAEALRQRSRRQTARTYASVAALQRSASSSTLTSSTPCTSPSRQLNSAVANSCGLPRGTARPLPCGPRAQPQRRDPPPLLAPITATQNQQDHVRQISARP